MADDKSDDFDEKNWTHVASCEHCGGSIVLRVQPIGARSVVLTSRARWCTRCGESQCCGDRLDVRLLRAVGSDRRPGLCKRCGAAYLLASNADATGWVLRRA